VREGTYGKAGFAFGFRGDSRILASAKHLSGVEVLRWKIAFSTIFRV
jgi:hypothetical protein